jgi:hypothetical protein
MLVQKLLLACKFEAASPMKNRLMITIIPAMQKKFEKNSFIFIL